MTSISRPDPSSNKPNFLARRGGWMLVAFGVALVALACVFADDAAIAPIFAFMGVASVVLGVLAARFVGDFELSATRLKGTLLAVAEREDLTLEDKGDVMVRIVEQAASPEPAHAAQGAWSQALNRGLAFEEKARRWFEANGWQVEPPPTLRGVELGDFIATKDGDTALVEVKARSRISTADIRQLLGRAARLARADQVPDFDKLMVAVPPGSLTSAAAADAASDSSLPIEIVEVPES
jgi:hypothetical protein